MKTSSIILSIALLSIANFSAAYTASGIQYDIIEETPNIKLSKDNLKIRLSKKTNKHILKEIATALRESRKQYDRLWIFYYPKGIPTNAGAWATTHYTPNLKVSILGSTEKEDIALNAVTVKDGVIIGKWKDTRSMAENTMIIFRKGKKLMLKTTFKDGSSMEEALRQKKVSGKVRYDYIQSNHGEYFMLEKNKNLGMYGRGGKFGEAKQVK